MSEGVKCPWCDAVATRVSFMDRWDPIQNGVILRAYRCCRWECSSNEYEGWWEVQNREDRRANIAELRELLAEATPTGPLSGATERAVLAAADHLSNTVFTWLPALLDRIEKLEAIEKAAAAFVAEEESGDVHLDWELALYQDLRTAVNARGEEVSETRMMTYPFSVREDVVAELRLPVDLTVKEAERLAQFIAALVVTEWRTGK